MQESGGKIGLLPESKDFYTREEVEDLILEVMKIAEDEIEKTAAEAGKSSAAHLAGDADYYRITGEKLIGEVSELKKENKRLENENRWLKGGLTVTGGFSLGALLFAILSGSAK